MQDPTNSSKIFKNHTYKKIKNILKKTALTTFVVASLSFAGSASASASTEKLTTVFYVYVNDNYIGTVSDKKVIEDEMNQKLQQSQESHENLNLSLNSEITYVPEQVFRSNSETNNQEVKEKINNEVAVLANASSLVIDGKPVAYVENEEKAKEVMKQIKLKYLSEEQLNIIEARKAAENVNLPPLKEDESRILDVQLSEKVSISNEKVEPDKILSVEDAIKLLEKGSVEEEKYSVKEGDVLGGIASAHDLDTKQLLALNPGLTEESLLQIGQELNVTVLKPYVQVMIDREFTKKETIPFEKEVIEDPSMPKGDTKVKQEGKEGARLATYRTSEQNGQVTNKELAKEEIIQEPVNHIVVKGTKVIPSRGDGSFTWPTVGGYISSNVGYRWGKMHKGLDIARPSNRTIKAADNGVVTFAGYDGGFGNKIVIDHRNGFRTIYAHLDSIDVSSGQTVSKGSKIGVMGSTGDSTGVHLHFELYKNGNLENPLDYVR